MQTKAVKILVLLLMFPFVFNTPSFAGNHSNKKAIKKIQSAARGTAKKSRKYGSGIAKSSRKYTEMECLTAVIYNEARGESYKGKQAVADVTLNRVEHSDYPTSVCSVVSEPGQYPWYKRRGINVPKKGKQLEVWESSKLVALNAMIFRNRVLGKDVLYFHAKYVHPPWAKVKKRVAGIDGHLFYKNRS